MQHAAGRVFHDDKHVEETKGRRDDDAKVTRDDGMGMITHKRPPALGRGAFPSTVFQALGHVLAYSAWRYLQAAFQQEFVSNAFPHPTMGCLAPYGG